MTRLSLGTVQFGIDYGVANKAGKVSLDEICRMLEFCRNHEIRDLDTAVSYGDAEKTLGLLGVTGFDVVTKLPPLGDDDRDLVGWINKHVNNSLENMKLDRLAGVLFHRSTDAVSVEIINRAFEDLINQGMVDKYGISYYTVEEALNPALSDLSGGLAQVPINLVDQSFVNAKSKVFQRNDLEVHGRSIFLQGLLLLARDELHEYFESWAGLWETWEELTEGSVDRKAELCISFAKSLPEIDCLVCGAQNVSQLAQIHEFLTKNTKAQPETMLFSKDPNLIYPYNWKIS